MSLLVVVKSIDVHFEDVVELAQTVPGAIFLWINFDGSSVGQTGSRVVFEFDKLVSDDYPNAGLFGIETESPLEKSNSLLMLSSDRIVITYK